MESGHLLWEVQIVIIILWLIGATAAFSGLVDFSQCKDCLSSETFPK